MKKFVVALLLIVSLSNITFADCDWSAGVTPGPNHTFVYSDDCHLAVGRLVQDSKVKDQQIADLTKAISLKDLAITNADARIALWQTSANNEMDLVNKIQSDQKRSDVLYFLLGVGTVFLAGSLAARLAGK